MASSGSVYSALAYPELSYVLITSDTDSLYASLSGWAVIEFGPPRLNGRFRANNIAVRPLELTDWRFYVRQPLQINLATSTFEILANPPAPAVIRATGNVGEQTHQFEVLLGGPAQGVVDMAAHRWSLQHTETSDAGTIEVSLQGSIRATSP